jgi:hypothetical protein
MKCLNIQQPYATLTMIGARSFEPRSWATAHRGLLAVSAGKSYSSATAWLCASEPFRGLLKRAGFMFGADLPRGKILGFVELVDCIPIEKLAGDEAAAFRAQEKLLGPLQPSWFAWKLGNPQMLRHPLPAAGKRGIYDAAIDLSTCGQPVPATDQ